MTHSPGVTSFSPPTTLCHWHHITDEKTEAPGPCDSLGHRSNEWWGGEVSRSPPGQVPAAHELGPPLQHRGHEPQVALSSGNVAGAL